MELTVVTKEVKLMALHRVIRIHQYLDDWLVRARSHQTCFHHTQILVALCQDLGSFCEQREIRTRPQTIFQLHRLPV